MNKNHVLIKPFEDLSALELYHILKTRQDILIVEQKIAYQDLDGKDLFSLHFWIPGREPHTVLSYVRLFLDEDKKNIEMGRVVTLASERGKGLSRDLVTDGIKWVFEKYPDYTLTLHAQEYLQDFYKSLGFKVIGPVFCYPNEDPLPHVPMAYPKD